MTDDRRPELQRYLDRPLDDLMEELDLSALFASLIDAYWPGLCLFTGCYRWRALGDHLGRGTAAEIHLPALTARQAIMLMDNLPRLRQEPLPTKIAIYNKVGGHPKSIEILEGWLAAGRVTDLLADPALDDLLAQQWEDYFLRALLAQLAPGEREALARLSIFRTRLGDEEFNYAGVEPATVQHWLDLSLLQQEVGQVGNLPLYSLHPVVRQYLLGQCTEDERRHGPRPGMAAPPLPRRRLRAGRRNRYRRLAHPGPLGPARPGQGPAPRHDRDL